MHMRKDQKFIDLIGDIHDAALEPALWSGILKRIADLMGGQASGLISIDPAKRLGNFPYNWGMDPHYTRLYAENYSKSSPILASLPRPGEIASISDVVNYDSFRCGQFYQEWARPQGWADAAYLGLDKTGPNRADILVVVPTKAKGMVDNEARRRLEIIAPHARRAFLIGKALEFQRAEAAVLADTMDGLSTGVFLVDPSSRLIHANTAGHDMLYQKDFLRLSGARLHARDAQINQALLEAFSAAATGDPGFGVKAIAVSLVARDGERYAAHVLPLTSGERRGANTSYAAIAALFVRKVSPHSVCPPEIIANSYKLTTAELRVLFTIVEAGGVSETAEALGVAETTVKTHLHRIFVKTGTKRQADLVKIVAGFSSPLADRSSQRDSS